MEEIWVDIEDYPGYEVSNQGRFKDLRKKEPKLLKVYLSVGGTPMVRISGKPLKAANLVANAFISNENPKDFTAIPKNNDPTDIRAENLMWLRGRVNVFRYCMDRHMDDMVTRRWPD